MTTCSYAIAGGEYARAGAASRALKEVLQALGVEGDSLRRLLVASYEAEMNVVIHARRGNLAAAIEPDRVDVIVDDEGPGIADVALAMTEGYSTAPPAARALGFGAGLGLPNIKKQSDELSIDTIVGKGTSLRFAVRLQAEETWSPHAVALTL